MVLLLFRAGCLLIQKSCNQRNAGSTSRPEVSKKENMSHVPKTRAFHSCHFCGRIHAEGHACNSKPAKRKKIDDAVRFRNSAVWHRKRQQIRERDCYLCQVCIRELYGTHRKYNYEGLQVHHAVPVNSSEELRLDDSNLITLCYMYDNGKILYDEVKQIILEKRNCLWDNFHKTSQFKP